MKAYREMVSRHRLRSSQQGRSLKPAGIQPASQRAINAQKRGSTHEKTRV